MNNDSHLVGLLFVNKSEAQTVTHSTAYTHQTTHMYRYFRGHTHNRIQMCMLSLPHTHTWVTTASSWILAFFATLWLLNTSCAACSYAYIHCTVYKVQTQSKICIHLDLFQSHLWPWSSIVQITALNKADENKPVLQLGLKSPPFS